MRVNAISNTIYSQKNLKKQIAKRNDLGNTETVAFKGVKNTVKGGLLGGGAAALLGLLTPFGWTILPLWALGGAIAGKAKDEEEKEENDDNNNNP